MRNAHRLSRPAYALAAVMMLFPALDLLLQVSPLQLGSAQWRFGSVGIASRMLITPLLGLFLAYAVAFLARQHRMLQVVTVMGFTMAFGLTALLGLFALDGMEVRPLVTAEALRRFDLTTMMAAVKLVCAILVALVIAMVGMRAARSAGRRANVAPGPGIVASHGIREPDTGEA